MRCNTWPKIAADPSVHIYTTEGEKKSYAATKAGFPCFGLGGVYSWMVNGKPHADLDLIVWKGRTVFIVFDSDAATNKHVQRAEEELAAELRKRGAVVHVIRLPSADDGSKQGIDDYLAAHGVRAFRALIKRQVEHTALVTVRLADVSPEHVTFLWFPYLPLGKLTLLEGNPGQGKSFIALQIAADLSQGRPLPGMKP